MRVSLYGNALNLAFLLGVFLRRKGHEARVFVNEEAADYDRPEWECVDPGEMKAVPLIPVKVDVKRLLLGGRTERRFRYDLAQADVVQTFGEGVVWSAGCGAPDTVLSIGDDLDDLPFRTNNFRIRIYAAVLRRAQRRCVAVCFTMPPQEESCRRLGLGHARFLACAVPVDSQRFSPLSREERRRVRDRFGLPNDGFVVFQPSRQEWTCPVEGSGSNHKGNDCFLRAYARFSNQRRQKPWLLAVAKGRDIMASQQLAAQLGIADQIRWIPQQNKANLRECLGACDIVADQFTYGFYGISTLEAMAVGRPVLVYLDEKVIERFRVERPPLVSVHSEDEIYKALCDLAERPLAIEGLGEQARQWIIRNHAWEPVIDRYLALYRDMNQNSKERQHASV